MQKESSVGPVIATIIILAVIVLGGLYFWGERSKSNAPAGATSQEAQSDMNSINAQSNSNTTTSIQGDLQNTDTTNLGTELNGS